MTSSRDRTLTNLTRFLSATTFLIPTRNITPQRRWRHAIWWLSQKTMLRVKNWNRNLIYIWCCIYKSNTNISVSPYKARIFLVFVLRPLRPFKNWPDIKLKYILSIFYFRCGDLYFQKVRNYGELFYKTCKKMEYVSCILKFIPYSYIRKLLEIVVKLKIEKCWPNTQLRYRPLPCVYMHMFTII